MTVVINTFSNLGKEKLLILILTSIFEKNVEDIPMIGADTYCLAC